MFVLGLVAASPSASAHALLAASDPPAGALLDAPPPRIVLTFTEAPDPSLSSVHVLDTDGKAVERDRAHAVTGNRQQLAVDASALPRGVYTVTWRTTSAVDGHTTAGSFAFGIGVAPASAAGVVRAARTPAPTPLAILGRWGLYAGLSLLLGLAAVALTVTGGVLTAPRRSALVAWLVAAIGLTLMIGDQAAVARVGVGRLLDSATGHRLAVEIAAVIVAGLAALVATVRPTRVALMVVGAAAAAAMLARARAGHASASSVPWLTTGVQWLHMVAVGVWIGGFAFLLAALRRTEPAERVPIARRFSAIATGALVVVIGTGTARAVNEVGAWRALTDTSFGVTLLVKLGLVAVVVALGAVNHFRHVRRTEIDEARALRRLVRAEVVVAAAVLAVTGVLAGLAPSRSVASARAVRTEVVGRGHDFATTIRARLAVSPGTPGPNHFVLSLRDYDSGAPVASGAVRLRFRLVGRPDIGVLSLLLRQRGPGEWVGDGPPLAIEGRWSITVEVPRAAGGTEIPLTIETRLPPQRVDVQRTKGLPTIYTLTLPSGAKIQVYADPGRPGANELHVTYLTAAGGALDASDITVEVRAPNGETAALPVRTLAPGHVVSDLAAVRGRYRVQTRARAPSGEMLDGRLDVEIR
jgi:copper transport protein